MSEVAGHISPDSATTSLEEILCRMLFEPNFASTIRTNTAARRLFRADQSAAILFEVLSKAEMRGGLPSLLRGSDIPQEARELYYQVASMPVPPARVLQLYPGVDAMPAAPEDLLDDQLADSQALMLRDPSTGLRWTWPEIDRVMGPMVPGDISIVGALPGNGKTSFLMGQMDALAMQGVPVLYVPLELDPAQCRLRWAAWRLGFPIDRVVRQEWNLLPDGAQGLVSQLIEDQRVMSHIQFASPKRLTLEGLTKWCEWAQSSYGGRVVIVDHLHRLDAGDTARDHRVAVTNMARRLKDLARDLNLQVIIAAQLNRTSDPLDAYSPPVPGRLKESSAIFEEADTVLMLSRKLRRDLPKAWKLQLLTGQITERDLEEQGIMVATCRKHRLDDSARDRRMYLRVVGGRVESRTWVEPVPKITEPEVAPVLAEPSLDL